MNKRRERIERFKSNSEFQRKQGDLQGCLEFKELAEELEKLEKIEQIVDDCDSGMISCEQLFLNLRTILEQDN